MLPHLHSFSSTDSVLRLCSGVWSPSELVCNVHIQFDYRRQMQAVFTLFAHAMRENHILTQKRQMYFVKKKLL